MMLLKQQQLQNQLQQNITQSTMQQYGTNNVISYQNPQTEAPAPQKPAEKTEADLLNFDLT